MKEELFAALSVYFAPICSERFISGGSLMKTPKTDIKKLTVAAALCAIAYLCTLLLHFKVTFLTFDFKDAIIAVSALLYGPLYGLVTSVTVALLEFVSVSETGVYGLIMNILSSASFACVGGLVYKYKRTFGGAISSVICSVIAVVTVMLAANVFITPFYMGVPRGEVVKLIPQLLLPFNLVKSVLNATLTLVVYKPLTKAFGRMGLIEHKASSKESSVKGFVLFGVCLVIAAAAVSLFVFYLNGTVTL